MIAQRDPRQSRWTGDRRAAQMAWDQEISDNPRPDIIAEYFAEAGINLPEEFTLRFKQIGNIEQWSIRDKWGAEIYRVRRIIPSFGKDGEPESTSHITATS